MAVSVPKVQSQIRVFSVAQRLPLTREFRPLLSVMKDATIWSVTAPLRRPSAYGFPNKNSPTSDSMRPYASSSRPSSEPMHDRISLEDHCTSRARSEATTPHPARPRSQPLGHLSTDRSAVDEHELVHHTLNSDVFHEEDRQRQDHSQPQQEVKEDVAAALMTEKVGNTHLSSKKGESLRLAKTGQDQMRGDSDSYSGGKLNKVQSEVDDRMPRAAKQKRPSSSDDGPTQAPSSAEIHPRT
jgi:hypothetical protein